MTTQAADALETTWADYVRGVHFPDNGQSPVLTGDTTPALIRGLALLDTAGEDAAAVAFGSAGDLTGELAYWLEVERAGLAMPPPGETLEKSEYREMRLEKIRKTFDAPGWTARMAEARRLLHVATCKGRTRSPDIREVLPIVDAARQRFQELGDTFGIASCAVVAARAHAWRGHLVEAQEFLSEAFVGFSVLNNRFRIADTAYELGVALRDLHRFKAARNMLQATLKLREAIGQPAALARVEQALGMTMVAEARYLSDRAATLKEGKAWALRAFARTSRLSGAETPDAEVVRLKAELKTKCEDSFRATVAARDLAEAALLDGDERSAKGWLNAALMESGLPPAHLASNLPSLRGQFVSPAFEAFSIADSEKARETAQNSALFERVRLAELEEVLSPSSDLSAASYGMTMIARVWRLRASPTYEIEAWLAAAAIAEQAAGAANAEGDATRRTSLFHEPEPTRAPMSAEAARMVFRSLRVAESLGSNIHSYLRDMPIVPLSAEEAAATKQADVQVLQLLHAEGPRRIFRVRAADAAGDQRFLVWKADRQAAAIKAILPALVGVSRRRNGLAEIQRFGGDEGVVWVLDEHLQGQSLANVMETCRDAMAACRMLGGLALTLRALMSSGVPRLRFTAEKIKCLPGDQLVVDHFSPLHDALSDGPLKSGAGKDTVVNDFGTLVSDWLSRPVLKSSITETRLRTLLAEVRRHRQRKGTVEPEDQLELMAETLLAYTRLAT